MSSTNDTTTPKTNKPNAFKTSKSNASKISKSNAQTLSKPQNKLKENLPYDYYSDEIEDKHEDSPDSLFNNDIHFGAGDADCSDQKKYDQDKID
ncbi:16249_t:CDS:2 [Cetraspora pellucida]|uniref:16249_t:CDS:1 n=1 Tax=Cetraspora pellucida TaxID=1433469 RepID=A0ACA9P185_9GLOM|nr:16249_t:CDS:2 [Cetraspora pellucida]